MTIEQLCVAKGVRMTERRRIIARILDNAHDHPDVKQIHRQATKADRQIAMGTVYRTVRLFEAAGVLARYRFGDGPAQFEPELGVHHDHLVDIASGTIVEFHDLQIERLLEKKAHELGYRLVIYRLELHGRLLELLEGTQNRPSSATPIVTPNTHSC